MVKSDGVVMIDVREAAALVGRTPETVRRWVWTRRIDAVKHGNRLMMNRAEVIRLGDPDRPAGQGVSELSLRDWTAKVEDTNTAGPSGQSASGLVLDNRAERQGGAVRAGR